MQLSWSEFKRRVLERETRPSGRAIYRGQSDSSWQLLPRLFRWLPTISLEHYLNEWLPQLEAAVADSLEGNVELASEAGVARFLTVLQANEFPTPLLDWTRSPAAAAYFAFAGLGTTSSANTAVTIWALDPGLLDPPSTNSAPFGVVLPHPSDHPRLVAQDGICTLFHSARPLDEALAPMLHSSEAPLVRFDLSVREAARALGDLELLGVHAGTLLSGGSPVCQRLEQELLLERARLFPRG